MHIVHIATEIAPAAKVGGLADVVAGLSRQQTLDGHQVTVIIPKYDCIDYSQLQNLSIAETVVPSFYDGQWHRNTAWRANVRGSDVLLIESHDPRLAFKRNCIYGCHDDIDRFAYFCRAALETVLHLRMRPDVLHLHDWHTAICAPLYYGLFQTRGLDSASVVLTLHNLEHQGCCGPDVLERVGLDPRYYMHPDRLEDSHFPGRVNLLKGGIIFSNQVVAVSPRYAQEILTPEGGRGLEAILLRYRPKVRGILNGLDTSYWDPDNDPLIPARFKPGQADSSGKLRCKQQLRHQLEMEQSDKPLIGCISRLVPQKGLHLIQHALHRALEKQAQFCLVGSSPIPAIQREFFELREQMKDNPNVGICLEPSEPLAHLLYAASDMLVVPSIFEPCGLTQMIAMRYGCVPIVRRTGGLADTIRDLDETVCGKERPGTRPNGFCFNHPDSQGVDYAVDRAIDTWYTRPDEWKQLIKNGIAHESSWKQSARDYEIAYQAALNY